MKRSASGGTVTVFFRSQQPLIEQESLWKDRYAFLYELFEYMKPLYLVGRNASNSSNRYYIVVPPDDAIQSFISSGPSSERRVSQSLVRNHILNGPDSSRLMSLSGVPCSVHLETATAADDGSTPSLFDAIGSVLVNDVKAADITSMEFFTSGGVVNSFFTFVFVDKALVGQVTQHKPLYVRGGVHPNGGSQPLWQRMPCSVATQLSTTVDFNNPATVVTAVAAMRADEQSFRDAITKLVACKVAHIGIQERTAAHSLLTDASLDAAMMHVDTELTIFTNSYACVDGFEPYITAKVNQIIEGAAENIIGTEDEQEENEDVCNLWSDEEREQLIVGFHTLVCGGVAKKTVRHWEEIFHNEDFAFCHACNMLNREVTMEDIIPVPGISQLISADGFAKSVFVLKLLDDPTLSVFSYMRLMEVVMASVVDALSNSGVGAEVTADLCIPLIVYVMILAAPKAVPSRIHYALDFSLPILEMSSLGYALTTFEAASAQLLEEYKLSVARR